MRIPESVIDVIVLSLILVVFSTIFVIIIMAKLFNLASKFILDHLASQEFREK